MEKFVCARPIHPGEVLKDEIEYRGISQGKLAEQMGMSYKMLNHILNERRPITTPTALLFEAALGVPADSLIRLQTDYNLQVINRDKSFANRLAEIRKLVAMYHICPV
jgi:addiction module HigA family antidote